MEDNRLNLNQPLLSVRRHSSNVVSAKDDDDSRINSSITAQIPHYRSELKSGPVRNPGVVPFLWEQSPGKPKEAVRTMIENSAETDRNVHVAADLPPGKYSSRTEDIKFQQDKTVRKIECVGENKDERKMTFETVNDNGDGEEEEDDDDDEAYVDALDTLSRAESSFLNCSMSGLSVLEKSDLNNTCGISSRDPQMLDLVMDRFLPAAKAMVQSETPQSNIPKKPTANREQSRDEAKKNVVRKDKPLLRYGPSFANRYSHYHAAEEEDDHDDEEEDGDSDDDYGGHGNLPPICGLLPRFCSKGSVGIISNVTGMRVRTRVPKSTCPKAQIEKKVTTCGLSQRDVRTCGLRDDKDNDNIVSSHRAHRHLMDLSSEDLKKLQDPVEFGKQVNKGSTPVNCNTEAADSQISDKAYSEFVISPPLPKSPSDSWLWRTLPTVLPTRNTPRHLNAGTEMDVRHVNNLKSSPPDMGVAKWEAIVKSAKFQHHK